MASSFASSKNLKRGIDDDGRFNFRYRSNDRYLRTLGDRIGNRDLGDGTSSPLTVSNQTSTGIAASSHRLLIGRSWLLQFRRSKTAFAACCRFFAFEVLQILFPRSSLQERIHGVLASSIPLPERPKSLPILTIATNEILIYAGGRDLPGNQLGEGGAGGISSSGTQDWINT